MTDKKTFPRDEILELQMADFAENVRRAIAAKNVTIIVNFDDGRTCTVASQFNPLEGEVLSYVFPILTLAQTVFDTAKLPVKVSLQLPDGRRFSEWNEVLENFIGGKRV